LDDEEDEGNPEKRGVDGEEGAVVEDDPGPPDERGDVEGGGKTSGCTQVLNHVRRAEIECYQAVHKGSGYSELGVRITN
jgi:hypothetical protein